MRLIADVLAEAEAIDAAATPGEWEERAPSREVPPHVVRVWVEESDHRRYTEYVAPSVKSEADAAFIARARSLVPELAAALKAVAALPEKWRERAENLRGAGALAMAGEWHNAADDLDAALQGTPSQAAEKP